MDIQHSSQDLLNKLIKLTISSVQAEPARRQSNTLIAVDMPSQIIPTHIEQYNKLYLSRLAILSKRIPLQKVYKVQAVEEKLGVIDIIGIFKRIQFKRVRAFEKEYEQYYGSGKKIYDQKDTLELEDATGKLKFTLSPNCTMNGRPVLCTDLPYGVVIGLTGKNDDEKMQFVVQKITLPNSPPQKPFIFQQYSQPRKTLVISSPSIQQIQDTLYEICSIANFQIYNTIKSIIIMGFSQKLNAKDYKRLDEIFGKYQQSIDIFIMPNQKQTDIYPQRPVHPILFSKSYKKMSLVSNPQIFYPNSEDEHPDDIQVENLSGSILVCSGQNIKDLIKNCSYGNSSLDSMESILQYSHLAPTSPFSLKCSMMPEDFLVLKELPHIFIAGGITQETMMRDCNFKSGKVKLIGIKNGESVLIDIDSHEVQKFYICSAAAELGIF